MKKYLLPFAIIFSISLQAQSLIGAWEASTVKDGKQLRNVVIFADGYQAATYYDAETGAFVSTNGGTWQLDGNTLTETVEFDTKNPERGGSTSSFEITVDNDELRINDMDMVWKRIDDGTPGE